VLLAITTAFGPSPVVLDHARRAAARHEAPYLVRGRASLERVAADAGAEALLVVGARRVALFVDGAEHAWSPGMGELRVRRLLRGERTTADGFLDAAGLRPGDEVLDATLGLGADALVAAAAVGPRGRVVAFEASRPLAALVAEGLALHPADAGRRVEVRCGDAAAELGRLAPRSFDVVVFDPMFRHPRRQVAAFDLVRRLGDPRPLAPEALAQATRVARRAVVVKDGTPGWDLARLGLRPLPSARGAKRLYGRIDVG
jgi:predicted O-methyltransferase YrrM